MTPMLSALPALVSFPTKITFLLVAAWIASLLLRRSSAAARHFVWASALGGVLLLPLLAFGLPRWNVALAPQPASVSAAMALPAAAVPENDAPIKPQSVQPLVQPEATSVQPLPPQAAPTPHVLPAVPLPAPRQSTPFNVPALCGDAALTVWALGFLLVLVPFVVGLRRITQIGKRSLALTPDASAAAEMLRGRLGVRAATFGQAAPGSGVVVPVTWGLVRPVVLLPAQSALWPDACVHAALLHELAHVKRGDWLTQCAARVACAVYWWHPLVWVAASQLRAESERACDDLVLSTGMEPADYARRLVEVVRSLPPGASSRTAAIAMAQPSEVEGRLKAVLDKGRKRSSLSQKGLVLTLAACAILLAAVSAFRLVARAAVADNPAAVSVPIAPGFEKTFSDGYTVSVVGVTQVTPRGDRRGMFGGPFWGPDGEPHSSPLGKPQFDQKRFGWTPTPEHPLYALDLKFTRPNAIPAASTMSTFYEIVSPGNGVKFLGDSTTSRFNNRKWMQGIVMPLIASQNRHSFSLRCSFSTGPWQTAATLPVHLTPQTGEVSIQLGSSPLVNYQATETGRIERTDHFFPPDGQIGNVARRAVLVDASGHETPLQEGFGIHNTPLDNLTVRNRSLVIDYPKAILPGITKILLQTRSYQSVEFRNIPLQPTPTGGTMPPLSAGELHPASTQQFDAAVALRAHLQPWADSNKGLLQQMVQSKPDDLMPLMAVYTSIQRLPVPLWPDDPRAGTSAQRPAFCLMTPFGLTLTHLQRSRTAEDVRIREDYVQYRDLEVSQSVGVGRVHITLWASGRITRSTERDQYTGPGKPILTVEDQQQIVPGFFSTDTSAAAVPVLKTAVGFRRYTSPPLPDGSRYTFLYPAYYTKISPGWLDAPYQFGTVRMDCLGSQAVPWIARPGQKPVVSVANHAPAPHEESFSVEVSKAQVTARPIPQAQVNNSQWVGIDGSHHALTLTDARTGYRFVLIHDDRYTPEIFKQTDPVIMASFRVLP